MPIKTDRLVAAYDLSGTTKMFLGRDIESICNYSKAIELHPEESYLYFFRRMAYESLGQKIEALKKILKFQCYLILIILWQRA